MRAVIIGAGVIAGGLDSPKDEVILTHAHAYQKNNQTELVGVCDINEEALANFSKKWGTPTFNVASTMLDECKPEIVSICSDTSSHAQMIKLALNSTAKIILCEKPYVASKEEFNEIETLLKKTDKKLLINFIRRYDPSFIEVAKIIKSNELGSVKSFQGRFSKGLIHNGSHMLELIEHLIGTISKIKILQLHPSENDFLGDFYIHSENANGVISNQDATNYDIFELDILLTNGKISINDQGRKITIFKPQASSTFKGFLYLREDRVLDGTLEQNMANFLQYALSNSSNMILKSHLELSKKLLYIADTLNKSSSMEF